MVSSYSGVSRLPIEGMEQPRKGSAGWSLGHSLMALYLGTSPVYWLPGLPLEIVSALKLSVLALALSILWIKTLTARRLLIPRGLFGIMGFVILFSTMVPGLWFAATPSIAVSRTLDMVYGFIMLWTFYFLTKAGGNPIAIFVVAARIIVMFATLVLTSYLFSVPDWSAPSGLYGRHISVAGFGSGRTGWSNGLALLFPFVLMSTLGIVKRRSAVVILRVVLGGAIIGSQFAVGGRAGLLASLITICLFVIAAAKGRDRVGAAMALCVAGVVIADSAVDHLRINRLDFDEMSFEQIDHFSAGRLEGFRQAIQLVKVKPVIGHGFGGYELDYGSYAKGGTAIHNLWLRMFVESGIMLPFAFLMIVTTLLWNGWRYRHRNLVLPQMPQRKRWHNVALLAVLINGVVISMLEPNILLGTFQNSAIWWAVAGVVAAFRGLAAHRYPGHEIEWVSPLPAGSVAGSRADIVLSEYVR